MDENRPVTDFTPIIELLLRGFGGFYGFVDGLL